MAPPIDPSGSSSIDRDGKTFFEVLLRELRDRIYEFTFDHNIKDTYYRYQFKALQPHLRLVSRQFKHEYDEQTPDNATLFVTACTNRFERHDSDFLDHLPHIATKCTAADVVMYTEETEGFARDVAGEQDHVLDTLSARLVILDYITNFLPRLQDIRIELNLNFAQSFDVVHEYLENHLDCLQVDYEEMCPQNSNLPNITLELRHLELDFPNLPSCLTSEIPDFEILERTAILGTLWLSYGLVEEKMKYEDEIERRTYVEAAALTAWKAQHGCTLSESALKEADLSKYRLRI